MKLSLKQKQGLVLLAPVVAAIVDALYLPRFHVGQYALLIEYLQFRAEFFLMLFAIEGVATIFIVARYRSSSWFTAILGMSSCLIPLNLLYVCQAMPNLALNSLFYMETEDNQFFYVPSDYAWLAILIAILVCLIGVLQGYISSNSVNPLRKALHGLADGGLVGAIAVLPLPAIVYFFDRSDFTNHVTLNMLPRFTNADLLTTSIATLAICLVLREVF